MSSIASELNALATASVIDIYKRSINPGRSDQYYLKFSKWMTVAWGAVVITFASFILLFENLIQAVNLVGSLLYGSIMGIFLVAFAFKWVKGTAVFIAALIGEAAVLALFFYDKSDGVENLGFLWYNPIGCLVVVVSSFIVQAILRRI